MARNKVTVYPPKMVNRRVVRQPGVRAATYEAAQEIGAKARANMARHRFHGNETDHEVTVTRGRVDAFVNLEGPAPGAVEIGHWYKGNLGVTPKFVPGLYIITGAAGLA